MSLNNSNSEQSRGKVKNLNVNSIHPPTAPTLPGDNTSTLNADPVAQLANPGYANYSRESMDYDPTTTLQYPQPTYITAPNEYNAITHRGTHPNRLPDVSTRTFPNHSLDPIQHSFFRENFPSMEGSSSYPRGLLTQRNALPFNAGYAPQPAPPTEFGFPQQSRDESLQATPSMSRCTSVGDPLPPTPDRTDFEWMRHNASQRMPPRAVPVQEVLNPFLPPAGPSLSAPNTGVSGVGVQNTNARERRQRSRYTGALLPGPGTLRQGIGKGKNRKNVPVHASDPTAAAAGSGGGHQYDVRSLTGAPTPTPATASPSTSKREPTQMPHLLNNQLKSRNREEGGKLALKSVLGKYQYPYPSSPETDMGMRGVAASLELKYVAEVEERKRLKMQQQGSVAVEEDEKKEEMIQKWTGAVMKRWRKLNPSDVGVGMTDPDSLYFAAALIEQLEEENLFWLTMFRNTYLIPANQQIVVSHDVKEPLDVPDTTTGMPNTNDRMEE